MGMALEESQSTLEKLESNGIEAYIDPGLHRLVSQRGNIYIDFVDDPYGGKGFRIAIKRNASDPSGCC